ncbi:MAG: glucose 1-dehydrogenase [Tannerella sp.]|jgi:NAD(P)-dependent dehydrogenase (short-subunit alcohol dehydrogenase family)|nr:glucose 1-dehydrogenase [Tannerella sp.]
MTDINLKGKKAIVTGGAQGIGARICKELAACGADVLVNYRASQAKAEALVQELKSVYGVEAYAVQADISVPEKVDELFAHADARLGRVDILVNNAGVENISHILDLEECEWDRIMGTNLKGAFLCAQQAGRRMQRGGGGVIINISSIHDTVPRKGLTHYCTSKAGLQMLSKCMALELAEDRIRVVTVSPGAIETEMNREEIAAFGVDKFNRWIPQGRIGCVADVAPVVAFLCSDRASYITGTDIYVDGGYSLSTIQYDPRPKERNTES